MSIEKKIFRLEIAVDDVHRVQVIEGENNFCGVELCNWVRESL